MAEFETRQNEFVGKSIEEATAAAVAGLGLSADQLDIEVLSEPGTLASLFGRRVRIKATPKQAEIAPTVLPTPARKCTFDPPAVLRTIVTAIVPEATVLATEDDQHLTLDIVGDGSGIFIGRKGATLEALQFILERMAQKQGWEGKRLVVESEHYRQRHAEAMTDKARRLAERARDEGRPQMTELLCAADRRLIHSAVKSIAGVTTRSQGEGEMKRVQILLEGAGEKRESRGRGRGRGRGGSHRQEDLRYQR